MTQRRNETDTGSGYPFEVCWMLGLIPARALAIISLALDPRARFLGPGSPPMRVQLKFMGIALVDLDSGLDLGVVFGE